MRFGPLGQQGIRLGLEVGGAAVVAGVSTQFAQAAQREHHTLPISAQPEHLFEGAFGYLVVAEALRGFGQTKAGFDAARVGL
jgi:hypothetical protein